MIKQLQHNKPISQKVEDKSMPSDTYQTVLQMARELSLDEQLQLLENLVRFIRLGIKEIPLHNVMEFEGIAKESWEGVDVAKYINEERNSWE